MNDINTFIEKISMDSATKTSPNISHDNPDPRGLTITYANIVGNNIPGLSKTHQNSNIPPLNSSPSSKESIYNDKLKSILHTAQRRVGLKPMDLSNMSLNITKEDIN